VETAYTAFAGDRRIAAGALREILPILKRRFDSGDPTLVLVFEDETGRQVDFDLRGALADVLARATPFQGPRGPGRPRLGVVSREVSLLPRHWEWLEDQPNGASAALRRLVDDARNAKVGKQRARRLRDAASRFMTAMAGDRRGYEEASRALFAREQARFEGLVAKWPRDVRAHLVRVSREATRSEASDVVV
jgi:hypothetical protein